MITVKTYSIENGKEIQRSVAWDGEKFIPSDNSLALKSMLKTPIYVPADSGKDSWIDPKKDPEQFIRKLCWQYKSYIFRVSEPEEI